MDAVVRDYCVYVDKEKEQMSEETVNEVKMAKNFFLSTSSGYS